jgi:hypothetical protein
MGLILPKRRKLLTRRGLILAAPAIIASHKAAAQFEASLFGHATGGACDPDFADVELLTHLDGTNGATSATDSSNNAQGMSMFFGAQLSTAEQKFGTASMWVNGGVCDLSGAIADYAFGSGDFTVEAWAWWDGTSATNFPGIVNFWPQVGTDSMWNLVWNRGSSPATLAFNWSTDGSSFSNSVATSGAYTPTASTWIAYACDRSGTTFRLYVNGAVVATKTASDTIFTGSGGDATIGNWGNTSSQNWTGYIDEVRVTKGIARYAGAYTPATAPFPNC